MHLEDFPASYIYEKILKESIYEKFNAEVRSQIYEAGFKRICQTLIREYQAANSKKSSDSSESFYQTKILSKTADFLT